MHDKLTENRSYSCFVSLKFIIIIFVVALLITLSFALYVASRQREKPQANTSALELPNTRTESGSEVSFGYHVEQLSSTGNTQVTIKQGGILSTTPIEFSFSYPMEDTERYWGIPRMYVIDYTATDAPNADISNFIMLAGYKFEAGNYYSEGNQGYVFEIKALNKLAPGITNNEVKKSGVFGTYLGETEEYIFTYTTFTNQCIEEKKCTVTVARDIDSAVLKLLKTFRAHRN